MLEQETKFFDTKLLELMKTDSGKFALIKGEKVHGTFEVASDALKSGYEKFRDEPFFVRQILPTQQPLNFANNCHFV